MLIIHADDIGMCQASRIANYAAMLSPELRAHVRQSGAQLIGYRPLRGLLKVNP